MGPLTKGGILGCIVDILAIVDHSIHDRVILS